MKTLFMLINHALTPEQEEDARKNLNIDKFVNITDARWSDIDPSEKSVIKINLKSKQKRATYCWYRVILERLTI